MPVIPLQKSAGGGQGHAGGMTADADIGKRHTAGLRPVGAVLPPLLRPAFRKRRPASAQLLLDWEAIVGPALAAVSLPKKLFAGTLAVSCSGATALELQHLSAALIERINLYLGHVAVTRLRFAQDFAPLPVPAQPKIPSRQAAVPVEGVPEGPLRDALLRLGRAVAADDVGGG